MSVASLRNMSGERKYHANTFNPRRGTALKRLLQGAAAGAVATMFVGFYWGGWALGSTAAKMAKERSELAVVAALAPVCADKFGALPDADAKKVALSKVELVEAQG